MNDDKLTSKMESNICKMLFSSLSADRAELLPVGSLPEIEPLMRMLDKKFGTSNNFIQL